MTAFKNLLKDKIEPLNYQRPQPTVALNEYIVDEKAKDAINDAVDLFQEQTRQSMKESLSRIFAPRTEITHVRENITIWGKKDNVAFSKNTLAQILSSFSEICPDHTYEASLERAGRISAYSFFYDFQSVLNLNGQIFIPKNIIEYMNLLLRFDARSGWWQDRATIIDEDKFYSLKLDNPFTMYPWTVTGAARNNAFLVGYFKMLTNCCLDHIRLISMSKDWTFQDWHCSDVKLVEDGQPNFAQFRLFISKMYIDELIEFDAAFYFISTALKESNTKAECVHLAEYIKELIIGIAAEVNTKLKDLEGGTNDIINNITQSDIGYAKACLSKNLLALKLIYDDYRSRTIPPK